MDLVDEQVTEAIEALTQMSDSDEPIAVVVRQVLSACCAMAEDDLLDVLQAEGIDLGHDPEAALIDVFDENSELVMLSRAIRR